MVRDRRAQGDEVGERHHRHLPRAALAGHRLRAAAPLHGRDRRRRSAPGASPKGGTGAISEAIAGAARAFGAEIRTDAPVAQGARADGRAPRRRARERRRDRAPASSSRASTRAAPSSSSSDDAVLPEDFIADIRRYKFRGSSGKVNLGPGELPDFTCLPGRRPAPARRDLDQPEHRLPRARVRRREVRRVLAAARTWTSSSRR